jgi:hypothetical protein
MLASSAPLIKFHGHVEATTGMLFDADTIKKLSYKVTSPTKFEVRNLEGLHTEPFMDNLAALVGIDREKLDFVYFSVCTGAEPHTDSLDHQKFTPTTFVVPIVLPKGRSVITSEEEEKEVELFGVYEFNHERTHSMVLEDNESGCVVVMVAVKY